MVAEEARSGRCCSQSESFVHPLWTPHTHRDLGRSTGLDAPALQELKNILEAKRRHVEEEATLGAAVGGEEEAWKADARMHRLLKTDEQLVSDRNSVLLAPAAVCGLQCLPAKSVVG